MDRARLAALAGLLLAACASPAPRIPFQSGEGWHASLVAGPRLANKQFADESRVLGLELWLADPGPGGWELEVAARYARGDGDGRRLVLDPATFVPAMDPNPAIPPTRTLLADSDREIDFYELDVGVRQTYFPGAALQPYVGAGGALLYVRTKESFVQPAIPGFGIPADVPITDHERGETRPGLYLRSGLVWNVLRDQLGERSEFPLALDLRGLLSVDYSYVELTFGIGFGR
jgi:hypothetical protein